MVAPKGLRVRSHLERGRVIQASCLVAASAWTACAIYLWQYNYCGSQGTKSSYATWVYVAYAVAVIAPLFMLVLLSAPRVGVQRGVWIVAAAILLFADGSLFLAAISAGQQGCR
jgi:hypothetical protein